jgi:hypothetical protein
MLFSRQKGKHDAVSCQHCSGGSSEASDKGPPKRVRKGRLSMPFLPSRVRVRDLLQYRAQSVSKSLESGLITSIYGMA